MMNKQRIIEDIKNQWIGYGNALLTNGNLEHNWGQLVDACVAKLNGDKKLSIIPAETGSGKSLGADTILAHLCAFSEEKALLVVLQKDTARQRADAIREMAQRLNPTKVIKVSAVYSDTAQDAKGREILGEKLEDITTQNSQLMVVCHAQLSMAAEEAFRGSESSRINNLFGDVTKRRKLIIVDEEISLVSQFNISKWKLDLLNDWIERLKRSNYSEKYEKLSTDAHFLYQMRLFGQVKKALDKFETSTDPKKWVTMRDEIGKSKLITATKGLQDYLKDVYWDRLILGKNNREVKMQVKELIEGALGGIDVFTRTWSWWDETDSSARMASLMTTAVLSEGGIILDATAHVNQAYSLLRDESKLIDCEVVEMKPIKNYQNCELRYAFTNQSGKGVPEEDKTPFPTTDGMSNRVTAVTNELERQFGGGKAAGKKILILTHKEHEKSIRRAIVRKDIDKLFDGWDTCHWGAVTGLNMWKDYDIIFVSSIFFLPPTSITDMALAMLGPAAKNYTTEFLQELHRELWLSAAESALIQAINRIAIRQVIDGEGNVPHNTQIWVVLPRDENGHHMIQSVLGALPGVQVKNDWNFEYRKVPAKGTFTKKHEINLVSWIRSNPEWSGNIKMGALFTELNLSKGTNLKKIAVTLTDTDHPLTKEFETNGFALDIRMTDKGSYYTTISR